MNASAPAGSCPDPGAASGIQRILLVGANPNLVSLCATRGDVVLVDRLEEVPRRIAQSLLPGQRFSLLVAEAVGERRVPLEAMWRECRQLDAALHGLLLVDSGCATSAPRAGCGAVAERCAMLPRSLPAECLESMLVLLLAKDRDAQDLQRTQSELISLNGRREQEIATAHADLIGLNHKLEAARDAAEAANRAKSAFLATMSHEIRTPMTAMLGFADYLLDEGDIRQAPRERIEAINTIVRNGHHLVQLINDILDLSKIEANRVEMERITCRPAEIIGDVLSLMRGRAEEKKLQLQAVTEGLVPETIQSDPTRLRQILVNVIGNAIKFTEEGHVRIAMRYLADAQPPQLQFEVRDTGIGMTPQQLGKLFQPFSQADMSMTRRYGGTGLGLCISQRFAELLGGRIDVSSELGQGTCFSISVAVGDLSAIRLLSPEALREKEEDPYAVAEARRVQVQIPGRVLVAEDGPDNQRLFAHLLRKAGATVTLVDNGALACEEFEAAATRGEPYHVILMDMQMPVLDGYAAASRLRAAGCELPILALTAFAMTGDRDRCIQAGCTDYLTKPIDRKVFLPMVARYVEQSLASSQQANRNGPPMPASP